MGFNQNKSCDSSYNLDDISQSLLCIINKLIYPPFNECVFNEIKCTLIGKCGVLCELKNSISCILDEKCKPIRYGYVAQIDRLLCLIDILCSRLEHLNLDSCCDNLIEEFLCVLVEMINTLLSIVNFINIISNFDKCNKCIYNKFINCTICNLIEDICKLEKLIKCLCEIIVKIINYELENCTPCYIKKDSGWGCCKYD